MAEQILPNDQANALSGSTDQTTGLTYPTALEDPWLSAFYRFGHRLNQIASLANNLRPYVDDADSTTLGIRPGRCVIAGRSLDFTGDLLADLDNNDVTFVWLQENAGAPALGSAVDSIGWPDRAHIKLAKVTVAAGGITQVDDMRGSAMLTGAAAYRLEIQSQGSTASPSRVHIAGAGVTDFIRVRVCDDGNYAAASTALIAPAGNTSTAEVVTPGKDLVIQSDPSGLFEIDVTNAAEETVTLRIGPADLSPRQADFAATLQVTHNAA